MTILIQRKAQGCTSDKANYVLVPVVISIPSSTFNSSLSKGFKELQPIPICTRYTADLKGQLSDSN